jgi:ceramide glucosyltransferase
MQQHRPSLGIAFLSAACLNRMMLALTAGWAVVRDRRSLLFGWLYPLRDLMGFGFWCASFLGRTILWRGDRYRLEHGGRMVPCMGTVLASKNAVVGEALPPTVTVDHLS